MLNRCDLARTANFKTDTKAMELEYIEKFDFGFDHIHPINDRLIGLSGGTEVFAVFDIVDRAIKWKYEEDYLWTERAIAYKNELLVQQEGGLFFFDLETGKKLKRIGIPGNHNSKSCTPVLLEDKLYCFNSNCIHVVDLEKKKKVSKIPYQGNMASRTWFHPSQEPIHFEGRFWIYTKKGKKFRMEGVAEGSDPIVHEFKQGLELAKAGILYKGNYYFMTTKGFLCGMDLRTGEVVLELDVIQQAEVRESGLRYTLPTLWNDHFVFFGTHIRDNCGMFYVDLQKGELSNFTVDLKDADIPAELSYVLSGNEAIYAISTWYDLMKFENGEISAWYKLPEDKIRGLEGSCFLLNEKLYAITNYVLEIDGDEEYCGAIVCAG